MNDQDEDAKGSLGAELRRPDDETRMPGREAEDRLVARLHDEGLLRRHGPARRSASGRGLVAAALALALFSAGVATGQWLAGRATAEVVTAALETGAFAQAMAIQEAGSAYVRAVARFTEMVESGEVGTAGAGREAAGVALHAAAIELARLSPDDRSIQEVLNVLDARAFSRPSVEGG